MGDLSSMVCKTGMIPFTYVLGVTIYLNLVEAACGEEIYVQFHDQRQEITYASNNSY
jgi:hypothetical protein